MTIGSEVLINSKTGFDLPALVLDEVQTLSWDSDSDDAAEPAPKRVPLGVKLRWSRRRRRDAVAATPLPRPMRVARFGPRRPRRRARRACSRSTAPRAATRKTTPGSAPIAWRTCFRKRDILDVGKCALKDGGGWEFPPGTTFMPKAAVPKALGRPGCRGDHLLRTTQKHYKDTKGVWETTDAEGDIVYWAHEGSL